ncbi:hypothetical protein Taro_010843 [Colocasia esculenta]|uniref:Uncharacterized protein n=1 Tax=Colocasia esculenta TaxID=4460 RepID=A0A843U459_COLES|nr:hypothetical protein [Colocasia esculenta]
MHLEVEKSHTGATTYGQQRMDYRIAVRAHTRHIERTHSCSDTNCNDPRNRPSAHAEDPIFAVATHGSGDPEGL